VWDVGHSCLVDMSVVILQRYITLAYTCDGPNESCG
jgi:hypothetical protein